MGQTHRAKSDVIAHPLDNGFYLYSRAARDDVSGVGARVGSLNDPRGKSGMDHVVEHMLGQVDEEEKRRLRAYGLTADDGTNTRMDRASTFYGHDAVLKRAFMLDLFDVFTRCPLQPQRINAEALARERAAVRCEYYLRERDYSESAIWEWMHEAMYDPEKNPSATSTCGKPEELLQITIEDARRFHKANYGSDTLFAVLLGIPFPKALRMVQERFGDLKPTGRPPLVIPEIRPVLSGVKAVEIEKQGIGLYHVAIGFPTGPYGNRDSLPLDVLGMIWQWRLEQLREENYDWDGGSYRIYVSTPRTHANGMIYLWFATPSLEFAQQGAEKVLRECARLRDEPIPEDLFSDAKDSLANQHKSALKLSAGTLCELIIEAACNGDPDMEQLNSYLRRLARVGKKTVWRVANEYFTPNACVHLLVKPAPTTEPLEKVSIAWRNDIKSPAHL